MREMKDSGNVWYGKIPYAWELNKIKYLTTIRSESAIYNPEEDKYIGLENVNGYSDNVVETDTEYDYSMQSICKKDDILFSKLRPYLAKVFIAKHNSFCTGEFIVFSSFNGDRRYLFYSILNPKFIENINSSTYGAKMPRANPQYIFDQQICLPPLDEQQRIAEFLDRECEKIDGLKENIQSQIDTLEQYKRSVITEAVTHGLNPSAPMKDSGVDYIDKIKSDWRITKIGFVCSKLARGFSAEDPALICSNNGSVMLRDEEKACGKMVSEDNAMQGIHIGDIAIHGMDTWHGAIGFSKIKGKITRVVHVCDSTEDKRFIVYYLKSLAYQNVYKLISNGVRGNTSDFRSWDKVKDIYICLPATKKEENEICDYLDAQCENIDMIIADKKSQIETLDSYKKSLIYEYVTGKKEVV